jgi:hypothetical protein
MLPAKILSNKHDNGLVLSRQTWCQWRGADLIKVLTDPANWEYPYDPGCVGCLTLVGTDAGRTGQPQVSGEVDERGAAVGRVRQPVTGKSLVEDHCVGRVERPGTAILARRSALQV